MNNKNIIIAGAIAIGLYLFSQTKKILPMTLQQKAAWHDKISHVMAHMTPAEIDNAYRKARKERASAEGTPEQKTRPTPMAWMLAIRAAAEEKRKEAQEEQGTGFDYIRERAPYNEAVPVEKRKYASILKSAERVAEEKRRRKEQIAAELEAIREKANKERIETEAAYRYELRKNLKPKDQQGYSKKKTQEEIYKLFGLWALPRHEVKHTQEPEEESKKQKSTDLGSSKKKTQEEIYKLFGLWALPTAPSSKSRPKFHHIVGKRTARIRPGVRRLIFARRPMSRFG